MDQIQYEQICKYVGRLYLESNHQLEVQSTSFQKLLGEAKKERDDALKLITVKRDANGGA